MAKRKARGKKPKARKQPAAAKTPAADERRAGSGAFDGYGKSLAAVIAGAVSTIVIWALKMKMGPDQVPADIAGAIQTLITTGAVYFTPQMLRQS